MTTHTYRRTLGAAGLALGLVASAGFGAVTNAGTEPDAGSSGLPDTIKIGVPLDTSGSAAVAGVGVAELSGVELAAAEIAESGVLGSTELELVVVDTKADKQEAVASIGELIERDSVDAIVGFTLTPSFLASAPLAQEAGVPVMAVGLSASGVTEVGDYIFRIYPELARLFAASDPAFVESVEGSTVAFLYQNDSETTVGQYEFRQEEAAELGLEEVATQTVTAQDTDFRAQLTEIQSAEPDVLMLNVTTGLQPGILLQAEEIGLLPGETQVLGDVGFGNATVVEQAGSALQCGLFSTTWDVSSTAGRNAEFVELYNAEHDENPDAFAAWGYDALWAMVNAMIAADTTDKEAVRDALAGLEMNGALGEYTFDEDRQPTQTGLTMQIVDGAPVLWTPDSECER